MAVYKAVREASPLTNPDGTMALYVQPPELQENQPPNLWYLVMTSGADHSREDQDLKNIEYKGKIY